MSQREEKADADAVSTRAGGRPPEEESSEDPEEQARAILGESDDRTAEQSDESTTP
ncbi:MAG TPA: hypothetical protein VG298_17750 [Acidimicrobiales bacterium]|nr:hypothetical protein [Acidimicrobiales bacterium]